MRVVEIRDLPERFRPSSHQFSRRRSRSSPSTDLERNEEDRPTSAGEVLGRSLPTSLQDLLEEATGELTEKEQEAFLSRIADNREHSLQDSSLTREEWRSVLVRLLKEQANRFMAAAAQAQTSVRQQE